MIISPRRRVSTLVVHSFNQSVFKHVARYNNRGDDKTICFEISTPTYTQTATNEKHKCYVHPCLSPLSLSLSLSLAHVLMKGFYRLHCKAGPYQWSKFKTSLGSKPSREHVHCFQYFSIDFCVDSNATLGMCSPRDTHQTILYRL